MQPNSVNRMRAIAIEGGVYNMPRSAPYATQAVPVRTPHAVGVSCHSDAALPLPVSYHEWRAVLCDLAAGRPPNPRLLLNMLDKAVQ